MPGEYIELGFSDYNYSNIRKMMEESGYPSIIRKIQVYVTVIGFDDDTIWTAGKFFKIDKNNPDKLIPIDKKKANFSDSLNK